jgi:hypothetical protein
LLEALEQLLGGEGENIRPIFQDTDPIFSSSPHTGLLWALETAAWDPEYLARASLILAKLAQIDPGGKLANRPIESLRDIFLPWFPNTNATLAERLTALDYVIANEPGIGWQLVVKLLPQRPSFAKHTATPRFHEAGGSERETVTNHLVWKTYSQIIDRALEMANDDSERWCTIVQGLPEFSSTQRERAFRLLEEFTTKASQDHQTKVWTALRNLVNEHRAFQDAVWAMKGPQLERLESIVERLEPSDPIARFGWLFDEYHPSLPFSDSAKAFEETQQERVDAIRQLYDGYDNTSIMALAKTVKLPRFVGFAAASVVEDLTAIEALAVLSFEEGEKLNEFVMALSSAAIGKHKQAWMRRVSERANAKQWTPDQITTLLLGWSDDPEIWEFVGSMGAEVERCYWQRKPAGPLRCDTATLGIAVRKYLDVGRALAAVSALHTGVETVASEVLFDILDKGIPELASSPAALGSMTVYELEKIFAALRQRPEVPAIEIARREYVYLPLLEHARSTLTLHQMMATDPAFFVSVLRDVFKPASGDVPEPSEERRLRARAGYELLSGMEIVPGVEAQDINAEALQGWILAVRDLAATEDRAKIADEYIGHTLAHSPANLDGTWPHEAVCELLEELRSETVERGILIERHNMRGVVQKAMYEGGDQERGLAAQATEWAQAAMKWTRAHSMLLQLARSWNEEARREDESARQDEMKFEQ